MLYLFERLIYLSFQKGTILKVRKCGIISGVSPSSFNFKKSSCWKLDLNALYSHGILMKRKTFSYSLSTLLLYDIF